MTRNQRPFARARAVAGMLLVGALAPVSASAITFDESAFFDAGSFSEGPLAIVGGGPYDVIAGDVGGAGDGADVFAFWWDGGLFEATLTPGANVGLQMSLYGGVGLLPIPIPEPAIGTTDPTPVDAIALLPIPIPMPALGSVSLLPVPIPDPSVTPIPIPEPVTLAIDPGLGGLTPGIYFVEVLSTGDPPFTISFNNPIQPIPGNLLVAAPEPATALLLGLGLAGLGARVRRRRSGT